MAPFEIVPLSQKFVSRNCPTNVLPLWTNSITPWKLPLSQVASHRHFPFRPPLLSAVAAAPHGTASPQTPAIKVDNTKNRFPRSISIPHPIRCDATLPPCLRLREAENRLLGGQREKTHSDGDVRWLGQACTSSEATCSRIAIRE